MRFVRRAGLAALAIALAVGVAGAPAHGDDATGAPSQVAWYSMSPTCTLPLGCTPLAAPSRYPAGTLQVGVTAGVEDARTYLKLDLGAIPTDASVTSATLTLPVGSSGDGTSSPDTAQLAVCPATAPFTAGEGQTSSPPPVDCTAAVKATYAAGPPAVFTVDIAPLVSKALAGSDNGIALMAAPGTAPGTSWHVAFPARGISAAISFEPAAIESLDTSAEPDFSSDVVSSAVEPAFTSPLTAALVTPPPASPAAAVVTQSKLPATVQPVTVVSGPGFAYPVIMVLPLLIIGLGGYLGWALTRPLATQPA